MASTTKEPTILDSFSLSAAFQAFTEALSVGDGCKGSPQLRFGDFSYGEPICVQFVFTNWYSQEQLRELLARAFDLGMRMETLTFVRHELVFSAKARLLKP